MPNTLVYGETGRFALSVNAILRVVKYWLRILNMPASRYSQKMYEMMLRREGNESSSCMKVKSPLMEFGGDNTILVNNF